MRLLGSKCSLSWFGLFVAVLWSACATDVMDAEAPELAGSAEALVGSGETFRIAPRSEQTLTIHYCFDNLADMEMGRMSVTYALNATWHKYANINFVDDVNCVSAPDPS